MACRTHGQTVFLVSLLVLVWQSGCQKDEESATDPQELTIIYPFDNAVYPPVIAPPTVRWQDPVSASMQWTIAVDFADETTGLEFTSVKQQWTPTPQDWEYIQRNSVAQPVHITVRGMNAQLQKSPLSVGQTSFSTSQDEVGAPIFYREVNLPFREAVRDPSKHIRWRYGLVSSHEQPPVVLENLPACGNCHSFSADGSVLGMDVDYANDKGSYAISEVEEEIVLDNDRIISWSEYRGEDEKKTFGLLSQVSPDGRYVVSTVKDLSVETEDVSHEKADPANIKHVSAPMPGKVFKLLASVGEKISAGDTLLTTEAMKMETNVKAKVDGVVAEIRFDEGDPVGQGDLLVVLE